MLASLVLYCLQKKLLEVGIVVTSVCNRRWFLESIKQSCVTQGGEGVLGCKQSPYPKNVLLAMALDHSSGLWAERCSWLTMAVYPLVLFLVWGMLPGSLTVWNLPLLSQAQRESSCSKLAAAQA